MHFQVNLSIKVKNPLYKHKIGGNDGVKLCIYYALNSIAIERHNYVTYIYIAVISGTYI